MMRAMAERDTSIWGQVEGTDFQHQFFGEVRNNILPSDSIFYSNMH